MFEEQNLASVELREVCDKCGKPISNKLTPGSITSWILGNEYRAVIDRWGCVCTEDERPASKAQNLPVQTTNQQLIGDWHVLHELDSEYLGTRYLVEHINSGQKAILRIFNPMLSQNRRIVKRFTQEVEKAKSLTHGNICLVYEHGALPDGTVYAVSEHIEGITLKDKIDGEGFLDLQEALEVANQICDALRTAHSNGVLHRTVKPSNIIIQPSGTVKLVDFGVEKAVPAAGRVTQSLTRVTGELGDPHYMSPEHCRGQTLDARSDIYSLGCVLYEMLTGKKVFHQHKGFRVAMGQLGKSPEPFSAVMYNCELSDSIEAVVMKTMNKLPEHRYQTVEELQNDLAAIAQGKTPKLAVSKGAPSYMVPGGKGKFRPQSMVAITAVILFIAILIGYFVLTGMTDTMTRTSVNDSTPDTIQDQAPPPQNTPSVRQETSTVDQDTPTVTQETPAARQSKPPVRRKARSGKTDAERWYEFNRR